MWATGDTFSTTLLAVHYRLIEPEQREGVKKKNWNPSVKGVGRVPPKSARFFGTKVNFPKGGTPLICKENLALKALVIDLMIALANSSIDALPAYVLRILLQ